MHLGNDADCRNADREPLYNVEQSESDSTDTCRILFTGETATRKEGIGKAAIVRRVRFPIEQLGRYGCGERDCVSQRARQAAVQGGREGEGARHRRHVHVAPRSHTHRHKRKSSHLSHTHPLASSLPENPYALLYLSPPSSHSPHIVRRRTCTAAPSPPRGSRRSRGPGALWGCGRVSPACHAAERSRSPKLLGLLPLAVLPPSLLSAGSLSNLYLALGRLTIVFTAK